jgi:hypothetical protein
MLAKPLSLLQLPDLYRRLGPWRSTPLGRQSVTFLQRKSLVGEASDSQQDPVPRRRNNVSQNKSSRSPPGDVAGQGNQRFIHYAHKAQIADLSARTLSPGKYSSSDQWNAARHSLFSPSRSRAKSRPSKN